MPKYIVRIGNRFASKPNKRSGKSKLNLPGQAWVFLNKKEAFESCAHLASCPAEAAGFLVFSSFQYIVLREKS